MCGEHQQHGRAQENAQSRFYLPAPALFFRFGPPILPAAVLLQGRLPLPLPLLGKGPGPLAGHGSKYGVGPVLRDGLFRFFPLQVRLAVAAVELVLFNPRPDIQIGPELPLPRLQALQLPLRVRLAAAGFRHLLKGRV